MIGRIIGRHYHRKIIGPQRTNRRVTPRGPLEQRADVIVNPHFGQTLFEGRLHLLQVDFRFEASVYERVIAPSEPQNDSARNIELVKVVVISDDPAPAPERIAPVSAVCGRDVCGRPLGLTAKSKMLAEVVFRAST